MKYINFTFFILILIPIYTHQDFNLLLAVTILKAVQFIQMANRLTLNPTI